MVDNRVHETEKTGKNTAIRTVGRIKILVSYYTNVAAYDTKEDRLYVTEERWSDATKRHINKFRTEVDAEEEIELSQFDLEHRISAYVTAIYKKRLKQEGIEERTFEETFEERGAAEEMINKATKRAGTSKKRVKKINVPLDIPVMFVLADDEEDDDED